MKMPLRKRQKGVFAIEFALGFIVLFMFTMLIFETCRLTYICSVLDYATAEAARDARVQLQKNKKYKEYLGKDCAVVYKDQPKKLAECLQVRRTMSGNEMELWYYAFLRENSTTLLKVFTSQSDFKLKVRAFSSPNDYPENEINNAGDMWEKARLAEYEVTYTYTPLMFRWSVLSRPITRRLLIVQDTALFRSALKVK